MSNPALSVDLSLVIPAFNEELRLLPTLERLHAHLSARPMSYEILVVDDGSRDKTREVVEAAATRIPNLTLVCQRPNRGKGAAVRRGMLAARGRIRIMWDADCSMPPEELPRLVAPIVAGTRGDRHRVALREGCQDSEAAELPRHVEPPVQQGRPALARSARARHAVRLQGVHGGRGAEPVRERDDRRLGLRSRRSSRWPAAEASRSRRSASSGRTTSARTSIRSPTSGR